MSDGFNTAAPPSGGISWEDLNGSLLLFDVLSVEHDVDTAYGKKDPVKANIAVLDGNEAGEVHSEALVFPLLLINQLKGSVGGKVLARLKQGQPKPGQKPPWVLDGQVTEDDKTKARTYLNGQLGSPQPATGSAPPF